MLTPFEYDVLYLRCLVYAVKDSMEPFNARKLADKLGTSINAIARACRSLMAGGYLDRSHNPTQPGRQIIKEPKVFTPRATAYQSKYLPGQN
ncbi:hypothetical protein [Larkinella punicea]|uniref:MarR family transcriptional regulator n=1 Tax=Larkinella punicea TaxID=2315727 RepID=A0A368JKW3_9BACT|nr:hypothetical protein [Larkinella punicea]RCR68299.1 hypothetical protein DUE52_18055 [Larkinella punicea]